MSKYADGEEDKPYLVLFSSLLTFKNIEGNHCIGCVIINNVNFTTSDLDILIILTYFSCHKKNTVHKTPL